MPITLPAAYNNAPSRPADVTPAMLDLYNVVQQINAGAVSGALVGEIRLISFASPPTGWKLCTGQILSIASFPVLYAVIGAVYGGDNITTFALPDMRNAVPMQVGSAAYTPAITLGVRGNTAATAISGTATFTLDSNSLPSHTHTATGQINASLDISTATPVPLVSGTGYVGVPAGPASKIYTATHSNGFTALAPDSVVIGVSPTGLGQQVSAPVAANVPVTIPPYLGLNFIIYAAA